MKYFLLIFIIQEAIEVASEYCQTLLTGLAIIIYNTCRTLPRVRALYDYEAADVDEISIREGDVFELVQEREYLDIYLNIYVDIYVDIYTIFT